MAKPDRYALFMGSRYYPSGGAEDLIATSTSEMHLWREALVRLEQHTLPWVHIYDLIEHKIVRKWNYNIELGNMEEVSPE